MNLKMGGESEGAASGDLDNLDINNLNDIGGGADDEFQADMEKLLKSGGGIAGANDLKNTIN